MHWIASRWPESPCSPRLGRRPYRTAPAPRADDRDRAHRRHRRRRRALRRAAGGDRVGGRHPPRDDRSSARASSRSSSPSGCSCCTTATRREQARAHAAGRGARGPASRLHSFIDGLGIGLAFQLDTATGLLVFLAVVTHDFADGLNTVSLRPTPGAATEARSAGCDRRCWRRWWEPRSAVVVTISEHALGQLLAVYAGFFLFMGATDLLPRRTSIRPGEARPADLRRFRRDVPDRLDSLSV